MVDDTIEVDMNGLEKFRIFREELVKVPSLRELGFLESGVEHVPATKLIPEGHVVRLKNDNSRAIAFKVFALADQELVSVRVDNLDDGSSFDLLDWLKLEGMFRSYDVFRLTSYPGPFHERVEVFLAHFAQLLTSTSLSNLLDGSHWKEVPFDWGGMR